MDTIEYEQGYDEGYDAGRAGGYSDGYSDGVAHAQTSTPAHRVAQYVDNRAGANGAVALIFAAVVIDLGIIASVIYYLAR